MPSTYDPARDLASIREDFARVQHDFKDLCTMLVAQAERELRGVTPAAWSYKLAPSPGYGLDVVTDTAPDCDDSSMSALVTFACSHSRDRVGDFLHVDGILVDNHRKNPVAFLNHGKPPSTLPIGVCEDKAGRYTVEVLPDQGIATARIFFDQHSELAEQVYELWKARILRCGSIGYRIIKATRIPADPERGLPEGKNLLETELLEVSVVPLPANADAVKDALGGYSLVPPLRSLLSPARPRPTLRRKPAAPLVARPALRRRVGC